MTRARIAVGALAYAALVAHLLFIPYLYSPLPFDETLRRFVQLPWMQLGSDQNVALASRGLMFAPLGLLLAAWVAPQPRKRMELPALLVAVLLGSLWALAINFAQLWFPTRTVSLNNATAEILGVLGGGVLWIALGATGLAWWQKLVSGSRFSAEAALSGYVVLYIVASLTPFDFVTSAGELAEKVASNLYGLWIAPIDCGRAPCELKFASALVAAIPCGWWFAARRREARDAWRSAVPVALVFATVIELLHFLMVNGVSQGASALMRASGIVLGAATYPWRHRLAAIDLDRLGRPAVVALLAPYLIAVAYVGGWFRAPKLGIAACVARLDQVVWLPFYYQYYSPYQSTMQSTIVHIALYAPVGVMCWLWTRHRDRVPLWHATLLAILLAGVAETSKVCLAGRFPDYSDVIIAAFAAAMTLAVLRFVSKAHDVGGAAQLAAHSSSAERPPVGIGSDRGDSARAAAFPGARIAGGALIALAAWTVIEFPVGSWAIALGLGCYAAILLSFPKSAYLIAIPALLPAFDLAPISGRFFWDEFDALLALTLGVRLLAPWAGGQERLSLPNVATCLLAVSVIASTAIALWPLSALDANAFSNYLSTYNALRIAKGYVWAGALLWLIAHDASKGSSLGALRAGLALGLLAAAGGVFWERLQFVGWSQVGAAFRASGLVSANHVGGAYLEAMLVMLAPFGLALAIKTRRPMLRLLWCLVVLLGAVAILVTLSRAALVAWLLSVLVFASVWWLTLRGPREAAGESHRALGAGVALLGVLVVGVLAAQSTQLRERMKIARPDLSLRLAHWKEAIDLIQPSALEVMFGKGLGSFPREFYLTHAGPYKLPAYRVDRDAATQRTYLNLAGGSGLFVDQRVDAGRERPLRLRGEIRSPRAGARLTFNLCVKSMLNSIGCAEASVDAGTTWQPFEMQLSVPRDALRAGTLPASVSLSLRNETFGSRIEVTRLSLRDGDVELLHNGSFERGLDRWFATSDVHLAWRTLSTPVEVAFDQGLLGVVAWLLLGAAAVRIIRRSVAEPAVAAAFAAAITGFVAVGLFDSLLDAPRIVVLVALIAAAGPGYPRNPVRGVKDWRGRPTTEARSTPS